MRRVSMLLLLLSVFHLGFSFRSEAQDSHTQKLIDGAKKKARLSGTCRRASRTPKRSCSRSTKNIPSSKPTFFAPAQPGSLTAS